MKADKITKIAMLAAASAVLQYLALFIPFKVGGFLDIDISDYPAIIASLAISPAAGVLTELLKNIIHLPVSTTGYIGELANFIVNGVFVLIVGLIYKQNKTKRGAVLALSLGTIAMTAAATLTNRYLLLPMFFKDVSSAVYWKTVFSIITPFNFARGAILSVLTFFSYKKLRTILK